MRSLVLSATRRSLSLLRVVFWISSAILGLRSSASGADALDAYKRGIVALDLKQWATGAEAFREAIAANPIEGGKSIWIYGNRFENYLPHYYLGLALSKQGTLEQAVKELEESERQGHVQKTRHEKELRRLLDEARNRLSPPKPPTAAPPPVAVQQPQAEDSATKTAQARKQVEESLDALDAALRELQSTAEDPRTAATLAESPDLTRRLAAARVQFQELRRAIANSEIIRDAAAEEAAYRLATSLLRTISRLRDDIGLAVSTRNTRLAKAPAPPPEATPATSQDAPPDAREPLPEPPTATSTSLAPVPGSAPSPLASTSLLAAARAFVALDYPQAIRHLEKITSPDPALRYQAYLLRAAARYAIYRAAERRDQALLSMVQQDIRTCRSLLPAIRPDPRLFSPSFRDLFARTQ